MTTTTKPPVAVTADHCGTPPWDITVETIKASPYQLMPPLATGEYEALREDIRVRGVRVPIVFDEQGNVIDGHNRLLVCIELGITEYRYEILQGLDEAGKRMEGRRLNTARRNLTAAQKRDIGMAQLKETPNHTDRRIGLTVGLDHKTVASYRAQLESSGVIAPQPVREDARGAKRPAEKAHVRAKGAATHGRASGRQQEHQPKARAAKRAQTAPPPSAPRSGRGEGDPVGDPVAAPQVPELRRDHCHLYAGTPGDVSAILSPQSVQVVICDNPLPARRRRTREFTNGGHVSTAQLQHYVEVGRLAAHALRPDGILAVPVEDWAVGQVIPAITPHVRYAALISRVPHDALVTAGGYTSACMPVLIFSPGQPRDSVWACEEYCLGESDGARCDLGRIYSEQGETVLFVNPPADDVEVYLSIERWVVAVYAPGTDLEIEMLKIDGATVHQGEAPEGVDQLAA